MAFEPALVLPHPQLHVTEALFWTSVAKKTGFLFPQAPSLGAIVSPQEHLSSPLAQYCRTSILGRSVQEDWAALSHPAPTHTVEEALPQTQQAKNSGPSIIPPQLTHSIEISPQERQAEKTRGYHLFTSDHSCC